jgi:predicted nucleotidyltransferase
VIPEGWLFAGNCIKIQDRKMHREIHQIIQKFAADTKDILKENLIKEYLFGSYAKNKQGKWSDIDILIIVNKIDAELRKKISSLSADYSLNEGLVFSPILKDIQIWDRNKKYNTLFYKEIQQYGIEL